VITITSGDMFAADVEALVNPVNCVGTMGKGLALKFKNQFPAAFHAYGHACADALVKPGSIFTFVERGKIIFHFPTKIHWRDRSRVDHIKSGLGALRREIAARGVRSVAVPALGCGLGGLAWDDVAPEIKRALGDLAEVNVFVYPPQ